MANETPDIADTSFDDEIRTHKINKSVKNKDDSVKELHQNVKQNNNTSAKKKAIRVSKYVKPVEYTKILARHNDNESVESQIIGKQQSLANIQARNIMRTASHPVKKINKAEEKVAKAKEQNKATKESFQAIRTKDTKPEKGIRTSADSAFRTVNNNSVKSSAATVNKTGNKIKEGTKGFKKILEAFKNTIKSIAKAFASVKAVAIAGASILVLFLFVMIMNGCLLASPLGVVFSNDNDGISINSAISTLNSEFQQEITKKAKSYSYNTIKYINYGADDTVANWSDIFAVWSVKRSNNGSDVAVIDDDGLEELKNIMWDMLAIDYQLKTDTITSVGKDAHTGKPVTITEKKKILYVTVTYKTPNDMATKYSFSKENKSNLVELLKNDEFIALFDSIGIVDTDTGNVNIVGNGSMIYPANGSTTISAGYGYGGYSGGGYHGGVDFPVPVGTNILAAADGTVKLVQNWNGKVTSGDMNSYGNLVILEHGGGLTTFYAHNSKILVKEGDKVKKGQVIAKSGNTGNSTGPHCHFETRINGNRTNPMNYLK